MRTKKNKKLLNKKNVSRKFLDKKINVLDNEELNLEDIILYTSNRVINEQQNKHLLENFQKPFTKQQLYLKNNDFFDYITKEWTSSLSSENVGYLVQIDDFRLVQYKVYEQLNDIILNYIKDSTLIATELKNLRNSALKLNSTENSRIQIKEIVNKIDEYRKDKNNLWKLLAMINGNEFVYLKAPLTWEVAPDLKDNTKYVDYLHPHTFTTEIPEIFSSNVPKELQHYKNEFLNYFKTVIKHTYNDVNLDDYMKVQNIFYDMFDKTDSSIKENEENYYKIYANEALEKYGFDWNEFCLSLGYKEDKIPSYFITSNLNYFKYCTKWLLDNWNSEMMRSFWIIIYLNLFMRLTNKWSKYYFEFYGKKLTGMSKSYFNYRNHLATSIIIIGFNPFLNNEYIDKYYNEKFIVYAKSMGENFRNIFINQIQRNKWLESKTKSYAIKKLQNIEIMIGNNKFNFDNEDLPLLNFNENTYIENMFRISEWRKNRFLTKNKKNIDMLLRFNFLEFPMKFLDLSSFSVNAQYKPSTNTILITNAYLQNPFINLSEQGISYNLAHLGFTIGHELSHSLDDLGSMYDIKGNLNDWWSKKDRIKFNKIQNEIIRQYNIFAKRYNIKFDAESSIGEDLADICSLSMCEEYLRDFCLKNDYSSLITFQFFREFYIYFTYQLKQKMDKKTIEYENFVNPHPPDKLRANVPLSRSLFFRNIYNIKPNEKMYWHNKDNIWS